jgi:hypothetical protein
MTTSADARLTKTQRHFLEIGLLEPIGRMPYRPEEHPIAAELADRGFIEYGAVEHKTMMSAKDAKQTGWGDRPIMVDCTSYGYFITDAGRAALAAEGKEK